MPHNGNGNGKPISSALLRRLAEAADGYRNVGPVVFLARPKENRQSATLFDISQGYSEAVIAQAEATAEAAAAAGAPPQAAVAAVAAVEVLEPPDREKFRKYRDDKEKPDQEFDLFGPFETDDGKKAGVVITEIVLKVKEVATGRETEVAVPTVAADGKSIYDCMFWSLSAVQKFAVPYYTRVSGTDVANRMEASFVEDAFFFTAHKPVTEWVNITAPTFPSPVGLEEPVAPQRATGRGFKVRNGAVDAFEVAL
jgi:hypothetical protein